MHPYMNNAEEYLSKILYYEIYFNKADIFLYAIDNKNTREFLIKKIKSLIKIIPYDLKEKNKDFDNIDIEKVLKWSMEFAKKDFGYGVYKTIPLDANEEEFYAYKTFEIPWMFLDSEYYVLRKNTTAYNLGKMLCKKLINNNMSLE